MWEKKKEKCRFNNRSSVMNNNDVFITDIQFKQVVAFGYGHRYKPYT